MKIWFVSMAVLAALAYQMPVHTEQNPPEAAALTGQWELDRDLTDRPAQVAAAIRADLGPTGGQQEPGGFANGRYGRGGRQGGGEVAPPRGGQDQQPNKNEQANREEQERLNTITAPLQYPPTRLTIAQSGAVLTFTDPQGPPRTIDTSGKKDKLTVGGATIGVTARFEGPQLVVQQDIGKGRTITWTYSLLPATKQLLVRAAISRAPGELGPFEIKQVYNRTSP